MSVAQLTLAPPTAAGLRQIDMGDANRLLVRWGHYLGDCNRPFGQEGWALFVGTEPISVAVSACAVSRTVAGYTNDQVVELARLCSAEKWATRVMLRLWREVAAPMWYRWPPQAAIAYSKNDRHEGRIYRFDGWEKVTDRAGDSRGGGTWTKPRRKGDPNYGLKTLWIWRSGTGSAP